MWTFEFLTVINHSQDECKWQFHNACYRSTEQRDKIKYNLGD